MSTLLGLLTSTICWGIVIYTGDSSSYYYLLGMPISPTIGIIGSALYLCIPSLFHAGPAAENASILSYVVSGFYLLVCCALPMLLTTTIVTVGVSSFFLGAFFQYIGRALIDARGNKIVGRK